MEAPPVSLPEPNESNDKNSVKENMSMSSIKKEPQIQNSEITKLKFEKPLRPNIQNEKKNELPDISNNINEKWKIQNEQPNIQIEQPNIQFGNKYPIKSLENNNNIYENQNLPSSEINIEVNQINKPQKEEKKCCNITCRLSCNNLSIKSGFMLKVYGILLTQFIFTFGIILITQINIIKKILINNFPLCLALVCIASVIYLTTFIIFLCNPRLLQKVPVNYIILFVITICMTIILVFIAICYPPHYVIGAMAFVIAISIGIFVVSSFNKIDIGFLYLTIISLCDLAFTYGILAFIYRSYYLHFLYCLLGGIIFALFIVFDTINIRNNFSCDDYILAAMTLYFDIIRLFIQILRILGSRGDRN